MYIVQLSIAHALIGLLLAVLWVFQDSDSFGRDVFMIFSFFVDFAHT